MVRIILLVVCILTFLKINGQVVDKIDIKLLTSDLQKKQAVVIMMKDQSDISMVNQIHGKDNKATFVYNTLYQKAQTSQASLIQFLSAKGVTYRSFYIVNMLSAALDFELIKQVASRDDVQEVVQDGSFKMLDQPEGDRSHNGGNRAPIWNITHIGAPTVWGMGYSGQNVVIGGQDTGYAWDITPIKSKYRGWNGTTANHNYNWHDAIHQIDTHNSGSNPCGFNSTVPCDDDNHGTHTMGTMVGSVDNNGQEIGVAPAAKWIGCRNMERGWGTLTSYVECFEWFLAPYPLAGGAGDPTKMPHVINNSWGCPTSEGCNTTNFGVMEAALNNLRNAGCVIVVSAGNDGPNCETVNSPAAIFSGSFSVGATNSSDVITSFSSRGAVAVDGSYRLKPNISAPGANIRSCLKDGSFINWNGTSMAGPHVAGLVALIISANPSLAGEVDKIEDIIEQTAVNLTSSTQSCSGIPGTSIPNNTYGYGRIDAVAAVNRAINELYVPLIKVDQFGYRPSDQKIAILSDPINGYNSADSYAPAATIVVKNSSTYQVVYSGSPAAWNSGATETVSGDKVWRFDFSTVTTLGTYHIADGNTGDIRSEDFMISDNIYNAVFNTAFKTFYYQRCGLAKSAPYALTGYIDPICHSQDITSRYINDPTNTSLYKNMSGGWHDAGDYNKYVNFAYSPLLDMLWSYEINPQAWASDALNLPESGNSIPDLLDEVKYELDWLLKMQESDGGAYCVLGVQNYAGASPPSADAAIRYYGPKTTSASLTLAATFAFAAKQFKKIDNSTAQTYANLLRSKAIQAWSWADNNPSITYYNSSNNLASGEQEMDNYDRSMRKLCAAIYLYGLTDSTVFKTYVENNFRSSHLMQWNFVYPYENATQLSLLHYSHLKGISTSVGSDIKSAYTYAMENYTHNFPALTNDSDAYKAHIESQNIGWGSNQTKCNHANLYQAYHHFNLNAANNATAESAMQQYLHYMHGVNPNALVYLTNMKSLGADRSINTIYHGWFIDGSTAWDDVRTSTYGPAPGFIPGGPNPGWSLNGCCPSGCGSSQANSLCVTLSPPSNQPALKSFKDWNTSWPQDSWSVTENAIYYQAAYLFLFSSMINQAPTVISSHNQLKMNNDLLVNTTNRSIILTSPNNSKYRISVSNTGDITTSLVSVAANSSKVINSSLNILTSEKGIVTRSPNSNLWRLSIGKAGELKATTVASVTGNHSNQQSGDFSIENTPNGMILKDENNICYVVTVGNSGIIFTKPTICN